MQSGGKGSVKCGHSHLEPPGAKHSIHPHQPWEGTVFPKAARLPVPALCQGDMEGCSVWREGLPYKGSSQGHFFWFHKKTQMNHLRLLWHELLLVYSWNYYWRLGAEKNPKWRRPEKCRGLENNLQKKSSRVGFINPRTTEIFLIAPIPHSTKGPSYLLSAWRTQCNWKKVLCQSRKVKDVYWIAGFPNSTSKNNIYSKEHTKKHPINITLKTIFSQSLRNEQRIFHSLL